MYIRGNLAEPLLRTAFGHGFQVKNLKATATELSGDSTHWMKAWSLSGVDLSVPVLLKAVDDQLSKSWKKTSSSDKSIQYTFTDTKGNIWTGTAEVVADSSKPNEATMSVEIHEGAPSSAK